MLDPQTHPRSRLSHQAEFRPDIEGLRAVSIFCVLGYHFFPDVLAGGYVGVDVFFVISGYLITRSLLASRRSGQGVGDWLTGFYARRARRLLPNALVVLSTTGALASFFLSDNALHRLGGELFASALYSVNWLFVALATDYHQWGVGTASFVLNFWSLAVEEQFYLLWPLALLLLPRIAPAGPLRAPAAPLLALLAASFAYCLWLGDQAMAQAFFSTPARVWELVTGASLAMPGRPGDVVTTARTRAALSLGGMCAIAAAAAFFDASTVHPGWSTLVPVLGAAAVVAAGGTASVANRALGSKPLVFLGRRSYSIYLWHWPILTIAVHLLGQQSVAQRLSCLALSLLLAEAAYRWVEVPLRYKRVQPQIGPREVLARAALASVVVATGALGLRTAANDGMRETWFSAAQSTDVPQRHPTLRQVRTDWPKIYAAGCHLGVAATDHPECAFGAADGNSEAMLFGDSHAAQWFPAVDIAAGRLGTRLLSRTKSGCPSIDIAVWNSGTRSIYPECSAWRESVFAEIERRKPSWVFVSNLTDLPAAPVDAATGKPLQGQVAQRAWVDGYVRAVDRIRRSGATVILLHDTPKVRADVLDCLFHAGPPQPCDSPVQPAKIPTVDAAVARRTGATLWDFTNLVCPDGVCPTLVEHGQVVVYIDYHHLTATFAATLAPAVEARWRGLALTSTRLTSIARP